MGSACQKHNIDNSDYSYTDEIKQQDFKTEKEYYPLKVHKGGRKPLHKTKIPIKQIETDHHFQESASQSVDLINLQPKSCHLKSTHSSSEKKIITNETKNQLISIIKQPRSYKNIQSQQLTFSIINSKRQLTNKKLRGQSEKHVRFKLTKSQIQRQRSHSQSRIRSNIQVYINL
ncbi:unnamed protein product [Paramecium sonneborni]|uniref:Uncharacterized protein n=1 Tax=Paramecium sonneborni TaxID=65129 RepID=A0A8S1LL49_9CILI|nr:unnamed protein product [Paramecium sonneborni]